MLHDKMTKEELLTLALFDNGGSNPTLGTKTITANGTYTASDDSLQGYSSVTVDIDDTDLYRDTTDSTYESVKTLSNCGAFPMLSLKVGIEPIQGGSGDPSPSNVRPISGWTEEVITVSPLNISQLYNGQIYGEGSWVPSDMRLTNASSEQDNSYFLKAGTYTLDYDKLNPNAPNLLQCTVLTKDDNYTIIDNFATEWNGLPFTFTLTQDGYLYFTIRKDADTNINPSDYRAKILGHTTTIPFTDSQGNPVEVYGGSVDVTNGGEQPNTMAKRLVSECTWQGSNGVFYTNSVASSIKHGDGRFDHIMSSIYKTENVAGVSSLSDGGISVDADGYIQLKDLRYSTASDFKTNMGTTQLVYELDTPTTFYTQPTAVKSLLGTNNIWADTGDVGDVRYFRKVEL